MYLDKWNVDPNAIPDCCWSTYRKSTSGSQIGSDLIVDNDVNTDSVVDWKERLWGVLENRRPGWGTKVCDHEVCWEEVLLRKVISCLAFVIC